MRQITIDSIRAFRNNQPFKRGNMEVRVYDNPVMGTQNFRDLRLHGNIIATLSDEGLTISTCGWNTVTTRERLNGLPGVHVTQRNFELFLNGEPWDGQRTKVELWL
jgi:hypothetical protein